MALGVDLVGVNFIPRANGLLVAADIHAEEWLCTLKVDREILIDSRKVRSPEAHRWFFAMLKKVVDATDRWPSVTALLDAVKIAVGHTEQIVRLDGETELRPKSISFGSLDQIAFQDFVRRSVDALALHLGIDGEALMAETDREQGGYYRKRYGSYR